MQVDVVRKQMKVQPSYTRQYTEVSQHQNNKQKRQNPAFGNFVVATMDAIEKGGLFASFAAQDVLGSCVPRTATAFYRNKDITGKWNYAEASEVSIREFVSSITMFLIPMVMMACIKKAVGKACDVPVNFIKGLGESMKAVAGKDTKELKKSFYNDTFARMFKDSGIKDGKEKASEFAQKLVDLEAVRKTDKKAYKKGMGELSEEFALLRKSNSANHAENYYTTTFKYAENKTANASFSRFVKHIQNYAHDAIAHIEKHKSENVGEYLEKFNTKRIGARFLSNAAMAAAVVGFYMYIPKLYTLHKTNPALAGLEPETKGTQKA